MTSNLVEANCKRETDAESEL